MKILKLCIVERKDIDDFCKAVNIFLSTAKIFSVKFQRNLYYAGVGSSDGYKGKTKGFKKVASGKVKLQASYMAFIVYRERK